MHRITSSAGLIAFAALLAGCADEGTAPVPGPSFSHAGRGAPPAAKNFVAPLNPGEEVPTPNLTETKRPTGLVRLTLTDGGTALDYKLISANITNVLVSHIHCGVPGVAGPVVVFLFGPVAAPGVDPNGILAQGTATAADVIPRPDSPACPGGVADFDDLIAQIHAGNAYVNVHTVQNPPGEIRGQLRVAGPGH